MENSLCFAMPSLALERVELGELRQDASTGCQLEAKGDKDEAATAARLNEAFLSACREPSFPSTTSPSEIHQIKASR